MKIYKLVFTALGGRDHPIYFSSIEGAKSHALEKDMLRCIPHDGDKWVDLKDGHYYKNGEHPHFTDEQWNIETIEVSVRDDPKLKFHLFIGQRIKTWFSGERDGKSTILSIKPYSGIFPMFFDCTLTLSSNTKSGKVEMPANLKDVEREIRNEAK